MSSARVLWASMPEALIEMALKRLTRRVLPQFLERISSWIPHLSIWAARLNRIVFSASSVGAVVDQNITNLPSFFADRIRDLDNRVKNLSEGGQEESPSLRRESCNRVSSALAMLEA